MALFLTEKDVREVLPMKDCIDVLEKAFSYWAQGLADNRARSRIRMPKGLLHFMAAAVIGPDICAFGYKSYGTFPGGAAKFLVMLYHAETGELLSIIEASSLGQIRTGAASGLATRYMARHDASVVGIIGAGYQARTQLEAVCAVRPVRQARVYSRTPEKRQAFAGRMSKQLDLEVISVETAAECIREADIAITITSSREPVLKGEWLSEGCHINAAGCNHWMRREIDERTVERAELVVVDDLEQAQMECGDLIWPCERGDFRWTRAHQLKDVVSGSVSGRPNDHSITLFESQGLAIEDVAAALHVYHKARELGMGQELPF